MSQEANTFRFAIGSADGPRSNTWRLWTERDGEDPSRDSVYLASRVIGDRFKVSLHPREWRVAFSERGLDELSRSSIGSLP